MSPTSQPPEPSRSRDELLGIVRTRATVLRRRRRAAISGTMALMLAVVGGGVAVSRGLDSGRPVRVSAGQGGEHRAPEPSTPDGPSGDGAGVSTTTTSAPSTTSSRPGRAVVSTTTTLKAQSGPTTTTTVGPTVTTSTVPPDDATTTTTSTTNPEPPVCRNSTDSRCGPFRWDPEPTKSPLTVRVSKLTEDAVVGKPVKFKVVADNQDTKIDSGCYGFSDGYTPMVWCVNSLPPCPEEPRAYGPWTPPQKAPDHVEMTPSFTYDKPGTYTVTYGFRTRYAGCQPWTRVAQDPYANEGEGSVTFTVRPAGEGGTTSTS